MSDAQGGLVGEPEPDMREELSTLVAALRAHLEWQTATGALCLPRSECAPALEQGGERSPVIAQPLPPGPVQAPVSVRAPFPVEAVAVQAEPLQAVSTEAVASPPAAAAPVPNSVLPAAALRPELVARGPTPEAQRELEALRMQVLGCNRCSLCETRTQTVFARGDASSRLCFVGEGPGADEDAQGLPFVGAAGQLLDRMIGAMGLSLDEVYVANIVKCRPPKNRKPTPEEMQACRGHLERQLELIEPAVIVALGATAVEGLLEAGGGITKLRGRWKLWRGKVAVMPTFHPAYLLRTPGAKREVWEDLQKVIKHLGREIPSRP